MKSYSEKTTDGGLRIVFELTKAEMEEEARRAIEEAHDAEIFSTSETLAIHYCVHCNGVPTHTIKASNDYERLVKAAAICGGASLSTKKGKCP